VKAVSVVENKGGYMLKATTLLIAKDLAGFLRAENRGLPPKVACFDRQRPPFGCRYPRASKSGERGLMPLHKGSNLTQAGMGHHGFEVMLKTGGESWMGRRSPGISDALLPL